MEPYFRTANGNLYQTWPRLVATNEWQSHLDRLDNLTLAFFGRQQLPWRFSENRPVSLVFFFHPQKFPAVYEVRRAQVVRFFAPAVEK